MIIKYRKEKSYGRERFYILDFKIQKAYEALSGRSTLTPETMKALKDLGFTLQDTNKVFKRAIK